MPPCNNRAELFSIAKHQQILGNKEEEYELILETQRKASVVREHEELHPLITEECPMYLEEMKTISLSSTMLGELMLQEMS